MESNEVLKVPIRSGDVGPKETQRVLTFLKLEIHSLERIIAVIRKNLHIYPRVVRFVAEVRDEYGRRYLDSVDEEGQRWRIMEASYFMQPVTTPVAMYPLLIERLA